MSSCLLSYLGGVLYHAAMISCGSDAVTDLVTGRIITPLPHDIAQSLTSPYSNCNHSICRWRCWRFAIFVIVIIVVVVIPSLFVFNYSTLGNAVYPWRLSAYCCVHWEWRAQILICFGSHNNYSGSCWVPSDILGWRMARWARFSCNQGIAHPWSPYGGLKMLE